MNDKVTISLLQLFEMFPNQEAAREYLESRLWPDGVKCPRCKASDKIHQRKSGFYRCNNCLLDFTVRTGTIFERSHIPLHKWIYAMYLLVTARKGISSLQLSKEIGITQKSAWFVLQRLREACGNKLEKLRGIIEIDESFFGGLEENKHESKKLKAGRGAVGKKPVLGMRERKGRTVLMPVDNVTAETIQKAVYSNIELNSTLYTDEHAAYRDFNDHLFFGHDSINHSAGEYKRGPVSVNSIESVWAVMKRGIIGVYHHASDKHLGRYAHEFAFRLNEGNVKRHTLDRLDSFVDAVAGKRLTYEELIRGQEN
jgi:transposase-like protein